MANQKALIAIFVALCLGTINAQGGNGACFQYNKALGRCVTCYRSHVDPTTGGCGQVLPATDQCNLYTRVPIGKGINLCESCKKGLVTVFHKDFSQSGCIPDTAPIKNCVGPVILNGKKQCYACQGGIPSVDRKSCLPWAQVKEKIPGCEIGTFDPHGYSGCAYCTGGLTWDEDTGLCQAVKGQNGCLDYGRVSKVHVQPVCKDCDVFHGYTQTKTLQCQKL